MRMNVGGDEVAHAIAFRKRAATPSRSDRVNAFDTESLGLKRRVAELMAAKAHAGGPENRGCARLHFDIADRLRAIHESATFRVDGTARGSECAHRLEHRAIGR